MAVTAVKKSAAERHAAAKAEIKRTEKRIDDATAHRREVLRHHDADVLAAVDADREIGELRLLRLRLIDQVELLPALVQREQSELANPPTAAACREFLAGMEARVARLRAAKRAGPVSAGVDAELDRTVVRCGEMRRRIAFLERFEAPDRKDAVA